MPPEFTEGQMALIRQAAFEAAEAVSSRLERTLRDAIELHQAKCPVKDTVDAAVNQGRGAGRTLAAIVGCVGGIVGLGSLVIQWLRK